MEAVTTSGYRVEIGEITNEVVEWTGSLKTPEREGSFSIVKIKDLPYFAGWFTWDGVQYELLPVKSSIAALRTMDMDYFQNTICGTKDDDVYVLNEGLVKSTPLTACDEPCSQFGAKIAAVLPPDYLDWLWEEFNHDNFYATLYHAIATQSFRNMLHMSGYPNAQITYIDHTISSFNYANPPNIDTDLTTFASQNVGQHILLVTGADVAVLLTAQNYTNETGAAIIGGQFAVVIASFAGAGSWTFAHETGHMKKIILIVFTLICFACNKENSPIPQTRYLLSEIILGKWQETEAMGFPFSKTEWESLPYEGAIYQFNHDGTCMIKFPSLDYQNGTYAVNDSTNIMMTFLNGLLNDNAKIIISNNDEIIFEGSTDEGISKQKYKRLE